MKYFLAFALVKILAVACVGSGPTHTPAPTTDIRATVEAEVAATRTAARAVEATVSAKVEATRSAVPTPTPVVITVFAPTPEPYVAAPGSMEHGIDELYRCLQESEELRSFMLVGMEQEGWSGEFADDQLSILLDDQDSFTELALDGAAEDSVLASALSLMGEMAGELCGLEDAPPVPVFGDDLEMSDAEVEALLGEFFDCYHSDPEAQAFIKSIFVEGPKGHLFEPMMNDRDLFLEPLLAYMLQDPDGADFLVDIHLLFDAMCR